MLTLFIELLVVKYNHTTNCKYFSQTTGVFNIFFLHLNYFHGAVILFKLSFKLTYYDAHIYITNRKFNDLGSARKLNLIDTLKIDRNLSFNLKKKFKILMLKRLLNL